VLDGAAHPAKDLVARKSAWLLWGVPFAAVVATSVANVGPVARTGVWTLSLLAAGIACVVNARRSRRRHCYLTGPFFLVLAALSFLHGSGVLSLGPWGWIGIGSALLFGTLTWTPEWISGKYTGRSREHCC